MILGTSLLREFAATNITGGNPRVEPCSIDLTLSDTALELVPGQVLRLGQRARYTPKFFEELRLAPGDFRLVAVQEFIRIPLNLCGFIHGKSTPARLAIQPHGAGLGDPGYEGCVTLEIVNVGPCTVILVPGDYVCQLTLHRVEGEVVGYNGKYQLASEVEGAKM